MNRLMFVFVLCAAALLVGGGGGGGCASSDKTAAADKPGAADQPGAAQKATPDASEIAAAERVAEQIERARVERNWAEVNRHLATVAYTPAQRAATPSFPFVELGQKAGELKSYELLMSMNGPAYRDPASGRSLPRTSVTINESYGGATPRTIETEFAMLKEDGEWRLAGIRAAQPGKRR